MVSQINYGENRGGAGPIVEKLIEEQIKIPQQGGGPRPAEDLIRQRIEQVLLQQHSAAKPPTLETIGQGFEKNIGEGVAQTANYLLNSPRGQKITGALMASQSPAFGKMMYQSGTALESDYRKQDQAAQLRRQKQAQLGVTYLKDQAAARLAKAEAKRKAKQQPLVDANTLAELKLKARQLAHDEKVLVSKEGELEKGLTASQTAQEKTIYTRFKKEEGVEKYDKLRGFFSQMNAMAKSRGDTIEEAVNNMSPISDAALVQQYQKMVLPNEAVMSDNVNQIKTQGWFMNALKDSKGGSTVTLTAKQRMEILEISAKAYKELETSYGKLKKAYSIDKYPTLKQQLSREEIDTSFILGIMGPPEKEDFLLAHRLMKEPVNPMDATTNQNKSNVNAKDKRAAKTEVTWKVKSR